MRPAIGWLSMENQERFRENEQNKYKFYSLYREYILHNKNERLFFANIQILFYKKRNKYFFYKNLSVVLLRFLSFGCSIF